MIEVCKFVREHYKPWANSPIWKLREYFEWYADMNLLGVVYFDQEVVAVANFRTFHNLEHYKVPEYEFVHDPAGQYVRINLYGALYPQAFAVLFGQLARKQDLKGRTFLWHRDVEELGPPRQYSLKQMVRMAEMMLHRRQYVVRESADPAEPYAVSAG